MESVCRRGLMEEQKCHYSWHAEPFGMWLGRAPHHGLSSAVSSHGDCALSNDANQYAVTRHRIHRTHTRTEVAQDQVTLCGFRGIFQEWWDGLGMLVEWETGKCIQRFGWETSRGRLLQETRSRRENSYLDIQTHNWKSAWVDGNSVLAFVSDLTFWRRIFFFKF